MQNLKINKSAFKLISVERIPRNKDGKVLYSDNDRLDTNNILKFY